VRLSQRVGDRHIPRHASSSLPGDLRQPVWPFAVGAEQTVRFLYRRDVGSTQCSPYQVVQDVVAGRPSRAASASQTVSSFWIDIGAARTDVWLAKLCPEAQSDGDSHSLVAQSQAA
jgi:hypothetical protein